MVCTLDNITGYMILNITLTIIFLTSELATMGGGRCFCELKQ